ncbi:MAG: CRISPR-associated helicase Cas3' [Kiritimatiellia bacterium]
MNSLKGHKSCPLARDGQNLFDHIVGTASLAQNFAEPYGLGRLAYACGLLHDIGKYSAAFQSYLCTALSGKHVTRGEVLHSWEGACIVLRKFGDDRKTIGLSDILSNIIASHHGGLTDMVDNSERVMPERIEVHSKHSSKGMDSVMKSGEAASCLAKIDWVAINSDFIGLRNRIRGNRFGLHLAVKFLFSCLVDADRCNAAGIDTPEAILKWDDIECCLNDKLAKFTNAPRQKESPLYSVRASISSQCAKQADRSPGIFSLSVPTGGGKTLSSLRFAVRHACANRLRRIIYVIPYLSIIDQTARDLRDIFGDHADEWLLEHHSNFLLESDNEDDEKRYDLGTQRWDAPIIVTTMVQFLETVMSNRASDLRKFHNMMQSVFVFDEIQALPVKCIHLFNATINFLHEFGGSSCVMCSATQPAIDKVARPLKFSPDRDLVKLSDSERNLFHRTVLVDKTSKELTCEEIASLALSRFSRGESTLVIVNTKDEARKVFKGLGRVADKFFLSTDMCPAHRLTVISRMRKMLSPNDNDCTHTILCVSTQLIEAGVDISFDCVIRAEAGFDSIIQAAGRCNRHGYSATPQDVLIVKVKDEKLGNLDEVASGKNLTARLLRECALCHIDDALTKYYRYKFEDNEQKILMDYPVEKDNSTLFDLLGSNLHAKIAYKDAHSDQCYPGLHSAFQSAAEQFSVIEGARVSVVVPYKKPEDPNEVQSLVSEFRITSELLHETFDREVRAEIYRKRSRILRRLQQYTISVYPSKENAISQITSRIDDAFYLLSPDHYNPEIGLTEEQGLCHT